MKRRAHTSKKLPEIFRPLLWSYRFEEIDPEAHRKEIIINAINYGDLKHWKWLTARYGRAGVRRVLTSVPVTELRPHIRKLVGMFFGIADTEFRHAPRGSH